MNRNNFIKNLAIDEVDGFKSAGVKFATKLWNYGKSKLAHRYGYSVEIVDNYKISVINDWIKSIDKDFDKRIVSDNGLLSDTSILIPIEENTILYIVAGDPLSTDTNTKLLLEYNSNSDNRVNNRLKIFIYGKYAKKYLTIIRSKIVRKESDNLKIFNISANKQEGDKESFQSIISDLKPRDIDTLFYEDGIKESVINHIDGFFRSKELYEEKNINYKTSLLLYGQPGTGKSSLANAICNKYGLDMVLVDMNSFDKLDVNLLTQCINGDNKTYVVVLEDIDTVFDINRDSDSLEKDDKKVINKLLQFLDSNSSPNNVIFIATTNHIEKLDEAIKRKGRIDKNVYIGPINKDKAREMCESFDISEDSINTILESHKDDYLINQSTLQADILDAIKIETANAAGIIDIERALSETKEPVEKAEINID